MNVNDKSRATVERNRISGWTHGHFSYLHQVEIYCEVQIYPNRYYERIIP